MSTDAAVRRPSLGSFKLDFEDLASGRCQYEEAVPIAMEYAALNVKFEGPGFGGLNGGVALDACALSSGKFPPLGNDSFAGKGFLGFSALHVFHGRPGKAIAPETLRFDVRMTNIVISFAGIGGHSVAVRLWSGPQNSFNDGGVLLQSFTLQMTAELQSFELVDENDLFVDCVRRIEIDSPAKMFVIDDLQYEVSATGDDVCVDDPAIAEQAAEDALSEEDGSLTGSAAGWRRHGAGCSCALAITTACGLMALAASRRTRVGARNVSRRAYRKSR